MHSHTHTASLKLEVILNQTFQVVQVFGGIWSIGQAITPMQNMDCREDYNVCTELESYAMESSEKTHLSGTPSEEKYRRHTQSRALRHTLIRIGCEGTPLEML